MAKVKFFHPRKLGKVRYPKGVCEVPAADCKGWFWDELVKCGDISEVADVVKATAKGVADKPKPAAGGPPKAEDDDGDNAKSSKGKA